MQNVQKSKQSSQNANLCDPVNVLFSVFSMLRVFLGVPSVLF